MTAMTQNINFALERLGYVFLPSFMPNNSIVDALHWLGSNKPKDVVEPSQTLLPRRQQESDESTYSGNFGLGEFPFHTDGAHFRNPPRYVMLRCVKGYKEITTPLIDGYMLVGMIGKDRLIRSLISPRKPTGSYYPRYTIYRDTEYGGLLRWDQLFLKPASKAGEEGFSAMLKMINLCHKIVVGLANSGDTLIMDNHRILHGRARILSGMEDRKLERIYMEKLA